MGGSLDGAFRFEICSNPGFMTFKLKPEEATDVQSRQRHGLISQVRNADTKSTDVYVCIYIYAYFRQEAGALGEIG